MTRGDEDVADTELDLEVIEARNSDPDFMPHRSEMEADIDALVAEVRRLRDRDAETRRLIEAWVRHGRAVPADVTTYDRDLVNAELLAIVERP